MDPALKQRYFLCYWSEARLRRHLEMLASFGYNSIQVTVIPALWRYAGVERAAWEMRLRSICTMARERKMSISLFVWGVFLYDADVNDDVRKDWHRPDDRAKLIREFQLQAASFACLVDRVITHWLDPGGPSCPQCCVDTVVEIHNLIMKIFRSHNPSIGGVLSNWMFESSWAHRWSGYDSVSTFARHPDLDPATDIAIGLMNGGWDSAALDEYAHHLKASDLREITAAGRRAGVWSWYTTDIETSPALHVHTDMLQGYFRAFPAEASTLLAWHSVEDTCQGLNMQNLYMAGRMMIDPTADARSLLAEFVRGYLGPSLAAAVVNALRVVEIARCQSRSWSLAVRQALPAGGNGSKTRLALPAGWLRDTLARTDQAIAELDPVQVDAAWTPPWPVTMAPDLYLDELKAHLRAIRQLLMFLCAVQSLHAPTVPGSTAPEPQDAIARLPAVTLDQAHSVGLEHAVYLNVMATLGV